MDPIWREQFGFEYRRQPRPVMARGSAYANGHREIWHSHEQAQLFYAVEGAARVLTPKGSWMLPPMRAIWLPPGVDHEIHAIGEVNSYSAYLEPDAAPWLWPTCRVVRVKPLMHELITALAQEPPEYGPDSLGAHIAPLLLTVLRDAEATTQGGLPLPSDRRLRAICSQLLAAPANDDTLDEWSANVGASARTLARLFRQETGLTFGQWRQQLRLVEAMSRLAVGNPVSKVAEELGYQSSSSFIAMFRREIGETPQRLLRRN
ncbi:AraC family transcriptional regulator [Paraburkholderia dilworthii]|uniref:Helix-turn-helix transcriptional regulator n=1 Tax=Paraburkholderia dilworthii TaxID=948106 RepID=A0ABW9DIJ6_9BURK